MVEYIRKKVKVDSNIIKIPELKKFKGEKVEVIILGGKDYINEEGKKLKAPGALEKYKNLDLICKEEDAWL